MYMYSFRTPHQNRTKAAAHEWNLSLGRRELVCPNVVTAVLLIVYRDNCPMFKGLRTCFARTRLIHVAWLHLRLDNVTR
ncbi:hypothetical protein DAI22_03g020900 [Oryza sativa Japonica Group]|nr:hypothetical protein DAI22_03g020900 [Oryza sativa Japonica Group]